MDELESYYATLLRQAPTAEGEHLTLDADKCPAPPPESETFGLFARGIPEGHGYSDSVRAEVVELFGEKASYRALGLLIFSSIFHSARAVVHLRREGDEQLGGEAITTLIVADPLAQDPEPSVSELRCRPTAYGYWPTIRETLNPLYDPGQAAHGGLTYRKRSGPTRKE